MCGEIYSWNGPGQKEENAETGENGEDFAPRLASCLRVRSLPTRRRTYVSFAFRMLHRTGLLPLLFDAAGDGQAEVTLPANAG